MEEQEENEDLITPNCPYCEGDECEHVLLDYDASFMDWLSGYLTEDQEEIYNLQKGLQQLIKAKLNPKIDDIYLESIWNYAKDNFTTESGDAELDTTAYFNFLEENINDFHGESFRYSDPDGVTPGYCSSYIIYYSSSPKTTIQEINTHIISVLKRT
tara:strand:+ start:361 stop:831 length:471 start_codon:yes stop_codon:yes gene_type:complete